MWAFATLAHSAPGLLDAFAEEATTLVCRSKTHDLTNTAWALPK
eukprot:gene3946-1341_t